MSSDNALDSYKEKGTNWNSSASSIKSKTRITREGQVVITCLFPVECLLPLYCTKNATATFF